MLRICQATFAEAASVLYGENTFVYLLRDGANANAADVAQLAHDDTPGSASDVEEAPESGPTTRTRRGRRGGRGPARLDKADINLDRYIKFFRRIAVEAEHNRFWEGSQALATNAVKVFTERYPWCPPALGLSTRLSSLEIRVVPMWEQALNGGQGDFTFMDWFEGQADLMQAVRALSCDRFQVRILAPPKANAGSSRRRRDADSAAELPSFMSDVSMYDLQPERLVREFAIPDPWGGDGAMQLGRETRIKEMRIWSKKLRDVLYEACSSKDYGERGRPPPEEPEDEQGDAGANNQAAADPESGNGGQDDGSVDVDMNYDGEEASENDEPDEMLLYIADDDIDDEDYED
ncbi:hypothetical protein PWT90_01079 [Aphanocladium album]|nr:hypothetical protein PWT90_01079 [Aphanocladium album]